MPTPRDEVLMLASRQGGWIAASQLRSNAERLAAQRLTGKGVLVAEAGLYRLAHQETTIESRIWRAVSATGGALSHSSAASWLGSAGSWRQVEVLVPYGRMPTALTGVVVHRTRRLPDSHVVEDGAGFRITTAPRTLVDICAPAQGLSDEQIVDVVDAWFAAGRVRLSWLQWFVQTEATRLPGRQRAARILGLDKRVDSTAERRLARLLAQQGLPACVSQHVIRDAEGAFLGKVDFAWPETMVALELDTYRYHTGPGVFVSDRQRGNEITLSGWTLLRTTWREIEDTPDVLVESLKRAFGLPPGAAESPRVGMGRAWEQSAPTPGRSRLVSPIPTMPRSRPVRRPS